MSTAVQGESWDDKHVQDQVDEGLDVYGFLVKGMCLVRFHNARPVDNDQKHDVDQNDNRWSHVTLQDLPGGQRLDPVELKDVSFVSGLNVRKNDRW